MVVVSPSLTSLYIWSVSATDKTKPVIIRPPGPLNGGQCGKMGEGCVQDLIILRFSLAFSHFNPDTAGKCVTPAPPPFGAKTNKTCQEPGREQTFYSRGNFVWIAIEYWHVVPVSCFQVYYRNTIDDC